MTEVLEIALLALSGICLLGALVFFLQGIQNRQTRSNTDYGVAKQEARHQSMIAFIRAGFALGLALILLAVYGVIKLPDPTDNNSQLEQPVASRTATATATEIIQQVLPSPIGGTVSETPTSPVLTFTPTPTVTPEPTPTPVVIVATVNSPNGLWLRERPGGSEEVELIPDGTELVVLEGRETADDIEWQQVRTPTGNEGWVAVDFLIFPEGG